jgi:hypothetical protein
MRQYKCASLNLTNRLVSPTRKAHGSFVACTRRGLDEAGGSPGRSSARMKLRQRLQSPNGTVSAEGRIQAKTLSASHAANIGRCRVRIGTAITHPAANRKAKTGGLFPRFVICGANRFVSLFVSWYYTVGSVFLVHRISVDIIIVKGKG